MPSRRLRGCGGEKSAFSINSSRSAGEIALGGAAVLRAASGQLNTRYRFIIRTMSEFSFFPLPSVTTQRNLYTRRASVSVVVSVAVLFPGSPELPQWAPPSDRKSVV
jgi:hypothetical protein